MVKQTIKIKGITEKAGKTGQKYFVIDTDDGTMSCFPDYKGLDLLREAWRMDEPIHVNVETSEDGKFKNIRNEKAGSKSPQATTERQSVKGSAYEKDPVGLAVEVFNELHANKVIAITHVERMKIAIELVKQAQKAFS